MSKSIAEKLNLMKYKRVAILHQPAGTDYVPELSGYDTELKGEYDLIFAFVLDMPSFKQLAERVIDGRHLAKNGYLYVAYPKKGNKVYPTFIHRDDLFAGLGCDENGYVRTSDIKFARMVGLDDVFTVVGLKREAAKSGRASTRASQRVDDYAEMVADIEEDLRDAPDLLAFYKSLTPGYRKDWARYVYSAKQEETRAKRREEMKKILAAGYKSRDLYRRDHS